MNIDELLKMSRKYGANADFVLAGGGNTSVKEGNLMAVKASGSALGELTADGVVFMDLKALKALPDKKYPDDDAKREALAIADMMAIKLPNQEDKLLKSAEIAYTLLDVRE